MLATLVFTFAYYCHYREVREGRMALQKDLVFPGAFTVEASISNRLWAKVLNQFQKEKKHASPNMCLIENIENHYSD